MASSAFFASLMVFAVLVRFIVVQIPICVVLWSKFPIVIYVQVVIDINNIYCLAVLTKLRSIPIVPSSKLSLTFWCFCRSLFGLFEVLLMLFVLALSAFVTLLMVGYIVVQISNCVVLWSKFPIITYVPIGSCPKLLFTFSCFRCCLFSLLEALLDLVVFLLNVLAFFTLVALLMVFGPIVVQIPNCVVPWSKFPIVICSVYLNLFYNLSIIIVVKVAIDINNIYYLVNLTKLCSVPIVPVVSCPVPNSKLFVVLMGPNCVLLKSDCFFDVGWLLILFV